MIKIKPRLQVNLKENFSSLKLFKQVLDARKWIFLFDSQLVEAMVLNTHAPSEIFLRSEEHKCAPFEHTPLN